MIKDKLIELGQLVEQEQIASTIASQGNSARLSTLETQVHNVHNAVLVNQGHTQRVDDSLTTLKENLPPTIESLQKQIEDAYKDIESAKNELVSLATIQQKEINEIKALIPTPAEPDPNVIELQKGVYTGPLPIQAPYKSGWQIRGAGRGSDVKPGHSLFGTMSKIYCPGEGPAIIATGSDGVIEKMSLESQDSKYTGAPIGIGIHWTSDRAGLGEGKSVMKDLFFSRFKHAIRLGEWGQSSMDNFYYENFWCDYGENDITITNDMGMGHTIVGALHRGPGTFVRAEAGGCLSAIGVKMIGGTLLKIPADTQGAPAKNNGMFYFEGSKWDKLSGDSACFLNMEKQTMIHVTYQSCILADLTPYNGTLITAQGGSKIILRDCRNIPKHSIVAKPNNRGEYPLIVLENCSIIGGTTAQDMMKPGVSGKCRMVMRNCMGLYNTLWYPNFEGDVTV